MARVNLLQYRRGTAATWTSVNPVLADGEVGYETDTRKQKVGDGVTGWNTLAYVIDKPYTAAEQTKLAGIATGAQVNPAQISAGEITAGTSSSLRSFAPADVQSFITQHPTSGGGGGLGAAVRVTNLDGQDNSGDSGRISAALTALAAAATAGELHLRGRFNITTQIDLPSMAYLGIIGFAGAEMYKSSAGTEYRLISRSTIPSASTDQELLIKGITFTGDWQTRQASGGDSSRLIAVDGYGLIRLENLVGRDGPQMGFTSTASDRVDIVSCFMRRICSNPFNTGNCGEVRVINCEAAFSASDFIAMNLADAQKTTVNIQNGLLVSGCRWYQTGGVKALGVRHLSVIDNYSSASRDYSVYAGEDVVSTEGRRNLEDVEIRGNHFVDLLPAAITGSSTTVDTDIFVSTTFLINRGRIVSNHCVSRTFGTSVGFSTLALGSGFSGRTEQRRFRAIGFDSPTVTLATATTRAIRIESAQSGLDRSTLRVERNSFSGKDTSAAYSRAQQWYTNAGFNWAIPLSEAEFNDGSTRRLTLSGSLEEFTNARLELLIGTNKGKLNSIVTLKYSIDSGGSWISLVTRTIDGTSSAYTGSYVTIPDALRYAINPMFAIFGSVGDGATLLTVIGFIVRLGDPVAAPAVEIPTIVTAAERTAGTSLLPRKFSPFDIKSMITTHGAAGAVSSVNTRTGAVVLTKADVALSNVTNDAQLYPHASTDIVARAVRVMSRSAFRAMLAANTQEANTIYEVYYDPSFQVRRAFIAVPLAGTNVTLSPAAASLRKMWSVISGNRAAISGYDAPNAGTFATPKEYCARISVASVSSLALTRTSATDAADMRMAYEVIEYLGLAGSSASIDSLSQETVAITGTSASIAAAAIAVTPINIHKCIVITTGIMAGKDTGESVIAWLTTPNLLNAERSIPLTTGTSTYYFRILEATGVAWKVHYGFSGTVSADTGTIDLFTQQKGTGSASVVADWTKSAIFGQFLGDDEATATAGNRRPNDYYPVLEPGTDGTNVAYSFDTSHVGVATSINLAVLEYIGSADFPFRVFRVISSNGTSGNLDVDITNLNLADVTSVDEVSINVFSRQSSTSDPAGSVTAILKNLGTITRHCSIARTNVYDVFEIRVWPRE